MRCQNPYGFCNAIACDVCEAGYCLTHHNRYHVNLPNGIEHIDCETDYAYQMRKPVMVKFVKPGPDAMQAAINKARAVRRKTNISQIKLRALTVEKYLRKTAKMQCGALTPNEHDVLVWAAQILRTKIAGVKDPEYE